MSQLALSTLEDLRSLDYQDPIVMAWVVMSLWRQRETSDTALDEISKKTKVPIPTRIKKHEDNTPSGLLRYFASCCNDIWGLGENLSPEYVAIMPQRMAGFAKSNGISGVKYRAYVDYLINMFMSKDAPPSVEWLTSRAIFLQFKQAEATMFAEATSPSVANIVVQPPRS